MSQQGFDFSKKSVKENFFFDLTFTDVHMVRQKVPESDFQSQFFNVKNHSNLSGFFFSLKNISLEEKFMLLSFFDNFNF